MRPGCWKLCDNFPHPGRIACLSARNSRPPATKALHTICGNNTSIVWSSWWWACKCPKHVEQIISAIKHSVASSWFSSLRLYYDARTNIHQIEPFCFKYFFFAFVVQSRTFNGAYNVMCYFFLHNFVCLFGGGGVENVSFFLERGHPVVYIRYV